MKRLIFLLSLLINVHAFAQSIADRAVTTTGVQVNYLSTTTGVTGTGNLVLSNSPVFTTPNIGAATTTSINKIAITQPIASGTLTIGNGTTLGNLVSFTADGIGKATLVSGTKAISIAGVTTSSIPIITFVSAGGTISTTTHYAGVCTAGTLTITALTSTSTTNTSDTSVISYLVIN